MSIPVAIDLIVVKIRVLQVVYGKNMAVTNQHILNRPNRQLKHAKKSRTL